MVGTTDTALRLLLFGEDKTASKALKGVGNTAGETEGKLSKFGGGASKAFGALKAGIVGLVTSEAVGWAKDAVDSYSELQDATAAAGVVFGKSMDKIITQSKTASSTMGMTQQQVIDAANTFGTYGKSAGLTGDKLAGFSTKMTRLSADMASFKGTSPEEAIEAVGSALRGETEPIRKYGVLLDDASMRQQAMKMGLIKTTKEALTPQQKVLAAQALILKQTSDAQGDFARTSDSAANVAKTASAKWTDFQATLGEKMQPAMTALTQAGIDLLQWVEDNPKVMEGASAAWDLFMMGLSGLWDLIRKVVLPVLVFLNENGIRPLVQGLAYLMDALGNVPGFEWAKDAATKLKQVDETIGGIDEGLTALGNDDPPEIDVDTKKADTKVKQIDAKIASLKKQKVKLQADGDTAGVKKMEDRINKLRKQKHQVKVGVGFVRDGKQTVRISRGVGGGTMRIAMNASGTRYFPGGLTWVGESGPELLALPTGSGILSNGQSRARQAQMDTAPGGAGPGVTNYISVQGDTNPNAAARRLHKALGRTTVAYGPGWRPVKGRG